MTAAERNRLIEDCISALTDMDEGIERSEAIENLEELVDRGETLLSALREDEEREEGE